MPIYKFTSQKNKQNRSTFKLFPRVKVLWRNENGEMLRKPIRPHDENIFKIYFADHTYTTVKLTMEATAKQIIATVCDKVGLVNHNTEKNQFALCEVRSNGDRFTFKNHDVSINTNLSINGRFFISPVEHLEAVTPLPEQEGPTEGTWSTLEMFESKEIAYVLTLYDWALFNTVHPYELIYQVQIYLVAKKAWLWEVSESVGNFEKKWQGIARGYYFVFFRNICWKN